MIKKMLFLFVAMLMSFSCSGSVSEAASGFPKEDTWVLNDDGVDIYVRAGSLNRKGRPCDAAPNFDVDCIFTKGNSYHLGHFEFRAKGQLITKLDGKTVTNPEAAKQLYGAICMQFHEYFWLSIRMCGDLKIQSPRRY